MMRTWKTLGLQGVLAAALSTAPGLAQEKDGSKEPSAAPKPDTAKVLEEFAARLKALEQRIEDVDKSRKGQLEQLAQDIDKRDKDTEVRIQKILSDLRQMQTDLGAVGSTSAQMREDVKNILSQLSAVRQDFDGLRKRFYEPPTLPQPAATGRVQLVNSFPEPMTVILNNRAYQLQPFETRTVTVPAGNFTFQVLRVHTDLQPRTVAANQTFTITVHPQ